MLKPAILYKSEIEQKFKEMYYTKELGLYYATGKGIANYPQIYDSSENYFQYAILNKNGDLIGYYSYDYVLFLDKIMNISIISFDNGNPIIGKTIFDELERLVCNHHKVTWSAISTNPACKSYDKFIKSHNGTKHILADDTKDYDGNYADIYIYEIINNNK